jgi:hypothetical protein
MGIVALHSRLVLVVVATTLVVITRHDWGLRILAARLLALSLAGREAARDRFEVSLLLADMLFCCPARIQAELFMLLQRLPLVANEVIGSLLLSSRNLAIPGLPPGVALLFVVIAISRPAVERSQ